jgi:hypothetical protein
MEDFVTWVDTSKIRRQIEKYNDRVSAWRVCVCVCVVNGRNVVLAGVVGGKREIVGVKMCV